MDNSRGRGRGRGGQGQQRGRGGGRGGPPGGGPGAPRMESPAISMASSTSSFTSGFRGRGGRTDSPSSSSATSSFEPHGRGGPFRGSPHGASGGGPSRGRGGPPQVFAANRPATVEKHLSPAEQESLITRFRSLTSSDRVIRPGFGKRGTAITLRANFFPVRYAKNVILYDYAIKITPNVDTKEKRTRKRLFDLLESAAEFAPHLPNVAHDRMQRLISKGRLPSDLSIEVPYFEEGDTGPRPGGKVYAIEIYEPKELKTSELDRYLKGEDPGYDPLPIISAFNLITSSHAMRTAVPCGKNRYFFPPETFNPPESASRLSTGVEAWKGFYTSVRPVYKQLMVNVNVCMSAFYVPFSKLSDAMLEFQRQSFGANNPWSFYDRVRVTTTHLGYRKRSGIKGFGSKSARDTVFQCDELGGRVSVEEYFKKKYRINLRHATDLPVVNLGNKQKDVFVPAELCEIEPGLTYNGKLSDSETAEMIKYACNAPYINAQMITGQGLPMLGLAHQASPMDEFGVEISPDMAVIPARILNPPKVVYKSGEPRVADGSWNILNVRFHRGAELAKFAVMVLSDGGRDDFRSAEDPALLEIVEGFLTKCRKSGMAVGTGGYLRLFAQLPRHNPRGGDLTRSAAIDLIEKTIKTLPSPPKMILVFMSNRDPHIYPGLKRLCDVKLGVPTVCMLMPKVRKERGQDQYYSNIALKVNTKLGGVNHQLNRESMTWLAKSMLVGMDVTHPGAGCLPGTPSIAAAVASCDGEFMQYPASLRLNESRTEMIATVKEMMIERLSEYRRRMNVLPERVLVFRDGVSEGQFDLVLRHELPKIKAAFSSFKQYNPKLTIAICGKRHHTRFYPTRLNDADKTSNTKAGTVVDQGITAVYDFDYYLQAHAGLQGTVRATHYTVIYDENRFQADVIQQGTNDVSYLWARATKSVSLIPPAYWADRACDRARLYLPGLLPPLKGSPESRMNEEQVKRKAAELWGQGVHANLQSTMYYL